MTEVTNEQLSNLIESATLTVDEEYLITDYPNFIISVTAKTEKELEDESYKYEQEEIVLHYVPETNSIDYMKDVNSKIEANFDWTNNIDGECSDIHFSDSVNLIVKNCSEVFVNGVVSGNLENCQNIVLKNGSAVVLNGVQNTTIGKNNNLDIQSSQNLFIEDNNTLSLKEIDGVSIGNKNSNLEVISGSNIIGSNNRMITITGDSNVIKSDNIDIVITGGCNDVDRTKYLQVVGSYNLTDKTTLTTLENAFANEVTGSHSVNITNTNNNVVRTDAIEINEKPPFVKYSTTGAVRKVENLVDKINLQADSTATTLIVDQQKFWQSEGTKDDKHYILVDGIWQNIE